LPTKSPARKRIAKKRPAKSKDAPVALVTAILEEYAAKAVFRGFSAHPGPPGKASYRMIWHHDRPFELQLDVRKGMLRFPEVLPEVPARSAMYRELQAFLKSRQSDEVPQHRRVDPAKARLTANNLRGSVALTLTTKDGDFEYATRKIINIVHEIFLVFLVDGSYFEYMVEHLGLDQDRY
jgi:hypothetical protein